MRNICRCACHAIGAHSVNTTNRFERLMKIDLISADDALCWSNVPQPCRVSTYFQTIFSEPGAPTKDFERRDLTGERFLLGDAIVSQRRPRESRRYCCSIRITCLQERMFESFGMLGKRRQ